MKPPKALALMSGGLDSMLAAKVVLDQGITVEGIYFFTGFSPNPHTMQPPDKPPSGKIQAVGNQLNIPIHRVNIVDDYKPIIFHAKHGYGSKQVNPCLDCKIIMVKKE